MLFIQTCSLRFFLYIHELGDIKIHFPDNRSGSVKTVFHLHAQITHSQLQNSSYPRWNSFYLHLSTNSFYFTFLNCQRSSTTKLYIKSYKRGCKNAIHFEELDCECKEYCCLIEAVQKKFTCLPQSVCLYDWKLVYPWIESCTLASMMS